MGQFPKLWQRLSAPVVKPDIKQRQWQLDHKFNDGSFEEAVCKLIPLHIPTAYLEGYKDLEKAPSQSGWPKNKRHLYL